MDVIAPTNAWRIALLLVRVLRAGGSQSGVRFLT